MELKGPGWKDLSPQRVAWGSYLLLDDTVHRLVEKGSEPAQRKGIGKRTLAYASVGIGTIATFAALTPEPLIAASFVPAGAAVFLIYSRIIRKATEIKAASGAIAQNAEALLLKAARLPLLLLGGFEFIRTEMEGKQGAVAYAFYFSSLAIAAYLSSGANGMIEKAKTFMHDLFEPLVRSPAHADAH
jgi:hypothetical protein